MDRLIAAVVARGMAVMARIDHAAGATAADLALRPTEVLLFGAARAGTPLMQRAQTLGLDLPLRALVWEDAAGATWVGYNDPAWLTLRHGDFAETPAVRAMAAALAAVTSEATQSGS
jgi:uncharacterized protein (DUF302 family)